MLAIDYTLREFFDQLVKVRWEWILAAMILTIRLLGLRLEGRSHKTVALDAELLACRKQAGNTQSATGNRRLVQNTEP